jgi:hypothetical protein
MKQVPAVAWIVMVYVAGLSIYLGRPFDRHWEWVTLDYARFAQNYLDLGYGPTKLGMYYSLRGDRIHVPEWKHTPYPNRGVISALSLSVWMRVLGEQEWVIRLNMIAVGVASLLLFNLIARRLLPSPWSTLGTALLAFNPMFWYASLSIVHMAYGLVFSLAAWVCALRWESTGLRRDLAGMFTSLFLACMSDWPGYYAVLSLMIYFGWNRRPRWMEVGSLGAAGLIFFGLHVLHVRWLDPTGNLLRSFLAAPRERSALLGPVLELLAGEAREVGLYFTLGMCGLAAVGIVRLLRTVSLPESRAAISLVLLGLDEVLFVQWARLHDYLTFGFTPFVALAAAAGARDLMHGGTRLPRIVAVSLLVVSAFQAVWVMKNRIARIGAYEISCRAGQVVRRRTAERERTLVAFSTLQTPTMYYAERYVQAVDLTQGKIQAGPSQPDVPMNAPEHLLAFLESGAPGFDWVVTTTPALARANLRCFQNIGENAPWSAFWIFQEDHPVHRLLERSSRGKEVEGAFLLYRLR